MNPQTNFNAHIYIASCDERGGIFRYGLLDGKAVYLDHFALDRPMYFVIENGKMYVLLRESFEHDASGAVILNILPDGSLRQESEVMPTNGICACHLSVCGEDIYVANYLSGSISKIGGKTVAHIGSGPNQPRQDRAHAHAVILSPDNKQVLSTDLGLDKIFVYDRALNEQYFVRVPDGYGVRHILFDESGSYLYAVNELVSSVSIFSYSRGQLQYLDTVLSKSAYTTGNTAAAIRLSRDGKYIYISNRGADTIERFEIQPNGCKQSDAFYCGGKAPRDFILSRDERHIISCNQNSNSVTLLANGNGQFEISQSIRIAAPLCAVLA